MKNRNFFLLIIIFAFLSSISLAQTNVSGNVSGTWNVAGSPYNVIGDLTIQNGTNLTIEPNVEIQFTDKYKFIVNGSITAEGTTDEHITFQTTSPTDWWYGFEFVNVNITNDSSIFNYCEFRESYAELTSDNNKNGGAFYIFNSNKIRISNSILSENKADNHGGAIFIENSGVVVQNNSITENVTEWYAGGVYVRGTSTEPAFINNNYIYNNQCTGLGSGGGIYAWQTNAIISYNEIANNSAEYAGGGVYLSSSNGIVFEHNEVYENFTYYDKKKIIIEKNKSKKTNFTSNQHTNIFKGKNAIQNITNEPTIYTNPDNTEQVLQSEMFAFSNLNSENKGFGSGGGVQVDGGSGYVQNNYIHHNNSTYAGGGIHLSGDNMKVNSNLITNNHADSYGGGMYISVFNGTSANNNVVPN